MRMFTLLFALAIAGAAPAALATGTRPGGLAPGLDPGSLEVTRLGDTKPEGTLDLPLQHTDVSVEVSGFVARATVTQHYHNPFDRPIEAVYTFPLPRDAAVEDMRMTVGERVIQGLIKRRDEARRLYEQAREQGQHTSLLEQERPNIFTQSVANILPGEDIVITVRYVNILKYEGGAYELVFPMVVGPRYIPGEAALGHSGTGRAPDTNAVPDASRITPPVLKPGQRSGHDIALSVMLDAGVPIQGVHSISHAVDIRENSPRESIISLHPSDTIPNKDFVLRYQVAGKAPALAVIPHHDERGGFFTLLIQPQRTVADDEVVPRELIFIVDTSGSMSGFPIEKSKEAMRRLINGMRPGDTFNVVRFAGDTGTLWPAPRPYTTDNAREALAFVERMHGAGGTEMRKGIVEALSQPASGDHLRIAFLLTDGYVGDEMRIFQAIEQESRGARVFTLGVGSSVNRYLLDRAAALGRGEAFYLRQDEDSKAVIDRFYQRVDRPALAYISIDWGGLDVTDLYPAKIPDLWAGQPVRIHGRYAKGGEATITLRGQLGTRPYVQTLKVHLPAEEPENEAMASVWARQKVRALMDRMVHEGRTEALVNAVTETGLEYRLMTQWTSFVAVEEKIVNVDGKPTTVVQPVELPEGVSYEGVFGTPGEAAQDAMSKRALAGVAQLAGSRRQFIGAMAPMPTSEPAAVRKRASTVNEERTDEAKPAAKTESQLSYESVSVSGGLRYPAVMAVLEARRGALAEIWARHLAGRAGAPERIRVMLIINADGTPASVKIEGLTKKDNTLAESLRNTFLAWRFPSVAGGGRAQVRFVVQWSG